MRSDPVEEGRRWLRQALREFQDAKRLREGRSYYLALFLYGQAAEKALKAYLFSMGEEEPIITHSVDQLLKAALAYDAEFRSISKAKKLDHYYLSTRYPNALPGSVPAEYYDDEGEAREMEELAEGVLQLVKGKMEEGGC